MHTVTDTGKQLDNHTGTQLPQDRDPSCRHSCIPGPHSSARYMNKHLSNEQMRESMNGWVGGWVDAHVIHTDTPKHALLSSDPIGPSVTSLPCSPSKDPQLSLSCTQAPWPVPRGRAEVPPKALSALLQELLQGQP